MLRERAELAGRAVKIDEVVVEGAFEAAVAGDRARHDALVAAAIDAASGDVIVLAQASMASAAEGASRPVLTSPGSGIRRLASHLGRSAG